MLIRFADNTVVASLQERGSKERDKASTFSTHTFYYALATRLYVKQFSSHMSVQLLFIEPTTWQLVSVCLELRMQRIETSCDLNK